MTGQLDSDGIFLPSENVGVVNPTMGKKKGS